MVSITIPGAQMDLARGLDYHGNHTMGYDLYLNDVCAGNARRAYIDLRTTPLKPAEPAGCHGNQVSSHDLYYRGPRPGSAFLRDPDRSRRIYNILKNAEVRRDRSNATDAGPRDNGEQPRNAMDRQRRPDASGKTTTASVTWLDAAPATEGRPDQAPRPLDQPDTTGPSSERRPQDPPPV